MPMKGLVRKVLGFLGSWAKSEAIKCEISSGVRQNIRNFFLYGRYPTNVWYQHWENSNFMAMSRFWIIEVQVSQFGLLNWEGMILFETFKVLTFYCIFLTSVSVYYASGNVDYKHCRSSRHHTDGWMTNPQDVMFYSVFKLALWLNIGSVPSIFTYGQHMVQYKDQDFLFFNHLLHGCSKVLCCFFKKPVCYRQKPTSPIWENAFTAVLKSSYSKGHLR